MAKRTKNATAFAHIACTHKIEQLKKNTIFHVTTYQRYNLGVATVKGKRKEGVEENANKLDHLKPGQVPGQLLRHHESTTTR